MAVREILAGKAVIEIGLRNRIEAGLKSISGRLKAFSTGISAVGGAFAQVGGAATGLFGGLGAALALPTQLAASLEQTSAQFETLLGSSARAKAMLVELKQFAASTPLQFQDIADAAQKLLAFGVAAGDVPNELRRIGDVASAIGAPLGEIAEIYGKAKTQGRLFMEDINQLTGRGIPIIQELAKQFGIAESGVKDLVSSGAVNFKNLQTAFLDLTTGSGKFAGMMAKQAETLSGRWSTFKDNMVDAMIPIGQAVAEMLKPLLSVATRLVTPLAQFIKQNAGVAKAVAIVAAVGSAAGVALLGVGGALMALGSLASVAASAIGVVGAVIGAVSAPVLGAVAALVAIGGAVAYAAAQVGAFSVVTHFIADGFKTLSSTLSATLGGVLKALNAGRFRLAGVILWSGLKLAFMQGSQAVLQVLELFWNHANQFQLLIVSKMISNAYNMFKRLPQVIMSALGNGVSLNQVLASMLLEGGNINISGMLDQPIEDAQQKLDNLNRRAKILDQQSNQQRGANVPQQQRPHMPVQARAMQNNVQNALEQQRQSGAPKQIPAYQKSPALIKAELDLQEALRAAERPQKLSDKQQTQMDRLSLATSGGIQQTSKVASSEGTFSATAAALFGLGSDNQPAKESAQSLKQLVGLQKRLIKTVGRGPTFA